MQTSGASFDAISKAQDAWAAAIESRDIDAVLACYHPDHPCLWGTIAGHRRDSIEQIRTYFDQFLARDEFTVTFDRPHIRRFGQVAISSGSYSFQWRQGGATTSVSARYSFVYEKVGDGWLIVDHHSSAMPDNGI